MFSENSEEPFTKEEPGNDYIRFRIDGKEFEDYGKLLLLSTREPFGRYDGSCRRDFTITKKETIEINEKFPSTSQGDPICKTKNCLMISREVLPKLIGKQLKPMDSDCLESIV